MLTATGFLYTADVLRRALQNWAELEAFTITVPANHCVREDDLVHPADLHCLRMDVERARTVLSERQQEAVQQHLVEGYTQEEAATRLGISHASLQRLVNRAIRQMVRFLNCSHPQGAIWR